jgi:hypothetical protein
MDYLSVGCGVVGKAIPTLHLEREEVHCLHEVLKSNINEVMN